MGENMAGRSISHLSQGRARPRYLRNKDDENQARIAALLTAANDAAQLARRVFLFFLMFSLYVAILVGSTTDEQLLRGTGAKLPVLNVEIPITATYVVVPIVYLLFHLNLLIIFYLLSRKLHSFNNALSQLSPKLREEERTLLYPFPYSQMLVGHHRGIARLLLHLMVETTIIAFPIILLLAVQVRFLPYHSEWMTWVHRAAVLADLLLLSLLWPKIRSNSGRWLDWVKETARTGWLLKRVGLGLLLIVGLFSFVCFSLVVATIPDEWIEQKAGWTEATFELFGTDSPSPPFQYRGLFSRNLDLRELTLVAGESPAELLASALPLGRVEEIRLRYTKGLLLQDRNLKFADFLGASLINADLRGTDLRSALLERANLQGAKLLKANLQGVHLREAQLQGANLNQANLRGANLNQANLRGALLENANLQEANLSQANLRGADLTSAQLQMANLAYAESPGTDLQNANLQGAFLLEANLQGANLERTNLQGAVLGEAILQGANLRGASLQGAVLRNAYLQGADLSYAKIGGTDFSYAQLDLSNFRGVRWSPLDSFGWDDFLKEIQQHLPEGDLKKVTLKRVNAARNRRATVFEDADGIEDAFWDPPETGYEWPVSTMNESEYHERIASFLADLVCKKFYSSRHLLRYDYHRGWFVRGLPLSSTTAKNLLKKDCEAVKQLDKKLHQFLEKLAAQADENGSTDNPPAPKPAQ